MSSTAANLVLVLCILPRAWAGDPSWGSFAAGSDRSADPLLIELLSTADFPTRIEVAYSIGRRNDPYAGDILNALASGFDGSQEFQRELCLRLLLASLFDPSLPSQTIQARLEANRSALDGIVRRITRFSDPQLASLLVGIIESLGDGAYAPLLTEEVRILILRMEKQEGLLSPVDTALLQRLIGYFSMHPSGDFLAPCLAAARLSRDARLVESARTAAQKCASLMQ